MCYRAAVHRRCECAGEGPQFTQDSGRARLKGRLSLSSKALRKRRIRRERGRGRSLHLLHGVILAGVYNQEQWEICDPEEETGKLKGMLRTEASSPEHRDNY